MERAEGAGRAGRAERAGMHWEQGGWGGRACAGKSSDRGHGPCETHEAWVVGAMWDHGAMSHGCQAVEGMGAMRWTWEGCMGGVRAGRAERAGMHRGPFK